MFGCCCCCCCCCCSSCWPESPTYRGDGQAVVTGVGTVARMMMICDNIAVVAGCTRHGAATSPITQPSFLCTFSGKHSVRADRRLPHPELLRSELHHRPADRQQQSAHRQSPCLLLPGESDNSSVSLRASFYRVSQTTAQSVSVPPSTG